LSQRERLPVAALAMPVPQPLLQHGVSAQLVAPNARWDVREAHVVADVQVACDFAPFGAPPTLVNRPFAPVATRGPVVRARHNEVRLSDLAPLAAGQDP